MDRIDASTNGRSAAGAPLLSDCEPPAYRIVNARGRTPMVFTCDHASHAVPRCLGNLGLEPNVLRKHIGWDVGAAEVTLRLARRFDAPAVLSGYSRLVIDCNRKLESSMSILAASDGHAIPGNAGIGGQEAARRADALFRPYHEAIARVLQQMREKAPSPVYVAVHSFTPQMNGGPPRPWHFGVLWDEDPRVAVPLIEALRANAGVAVGDNEPYSARDHFDFSQEYHASSKGLPSALVEIREDLIRDGAGVERHADMLGDALAVAVADLVPLRVPATL